MNKPEMRTFGGYLVNMHYLTVGTHIIIKVDITNFIVVLSFTLVTSLSSYFPVLFPLAPLD